MNNVTRNPSVGVGRLSKSMYGVGSVMVAPIHGGLRSSTCRSKGGWGKHSRVCGPGHATGGAQCSTTGGNCQPERHGGLNGNPPTIGRTMNKMLSKTRNLLVAAAGAAVLLAGATTAQAAQSKSTDVTGPSQPKPTIVL